MSFKENTNYYKEVKIPVRIIMTQGTKGRISGQIPEETNLGGFNYFLKKAGNLALIIALISSQVYLLSAFEAHIINVTARICDFSETRTMGFWKNHPEVYENCLSQYLGGEPVSTEEDVEQVFDNANAKEMRDMLKAQLLAMKFNIACFGIESDDGELFDGKTLAAIVAKADDLLRDPSSTREEQEPVKNLLDDLNNRPEIRYCSTNTFSLFDDTFFQASLIDGININSFDTTTPNEDGINISSSDTTTPSEDGVVSGG